MKRRIKIVFAVFVSFLLFGCAPIYAPMSKDVQKNIGSLDTVLVMEQSNLNVTVRSSDMGYGGLIGSLILAGVDAVREAHAKKEAAPIIAKLQKYDFRQVMYNALSDQLKNAKEFKVNQPIKLQKVTSKTDNRIVFDDSKANAVMFCFVGYRIESQNLIVSMIASIYPKSDSLKKFRKHPDDSNPLAAGNTIYSNQFIFQKESVTAENIVDGLNEAAKSLTLQIIKDLNHGI